jgi:hypothetical protein
VSGVHRVARVAPAVLAVVVWGWSGAAHAAVEWSLPAGSQVSLGYGAAWVGASGTTCTHRGVDIPAASGAAVVGCVAGRVAFAGGVPAAGGGTVRAVTVATADGLRVTYMPLESAEVRAGEDIPAGVVVGTLAEGGDASTASSHLHLSVRRGDAFLDPAAFLRAAPAPEALPSAPPVGGSIPVAPREPTAVSAPAEAMPAPAPAMPTGVARRLAESPRPVRRAPIPASDPVPVDDTVGRAVLGSVPRFDGRAIHRPRTDAFAGARTVLRAARSTAMASAGLIARLVSALFGALFLRALFRGAADRGTLAPSPLRVARGHGGRRIP